MFKSKVVNKHEIEALRAAASKLQEHGQYAEAAENYARAAEAYLEENPLIYGDCSKSTGKGNVSGNFWALLGHFLRQNYRLRYSCYSVDLSERFELEVLLPTRGPAWLT